MPCVTYFNEAELKPINDKETNELLADLNRLSGRRWVVKEYVWIFPRLFRRDKILKTYDLLLDCHGEWQIINWALQEDSPARTLEAVKMYLYGAIGAYERKTGPLVGLLREARQRIEAALRLRVRLGFVYDEDEAFLAKLDAALAASKEPPSDHPRPRETAAESYTQAQRDDHPTEGLPDWLEWEAIAERMRTNGADPYNCTLSDVLLAVRKLARAAASNMTTPRGHDERPTARTI